jgi:hypothetical protein
MRSLRWGILALILYFFAGLIVLPFVNVQKAMEDVKEHS